MTTRLFVSDDLINGARIELGGERARYLGRVLRARVGERVLLFDGSGREWSAQVTGIERDRVALALGAATEPPTESPLATWLVQGISRGERMDVVIQKATELGVHRISPVMTERSVVRLAGERAARRQAHWRKIAESACEQCGRTRPPSIDAPQTLDSWLGTLGPGIEPMLFVPGATATLAELEDPAGEAVLLVGPEGGFSPQEIDAAKRSGCRPVSLGPRILRTESAGIVALAVVQARWGDLDGRR